MPSHSDDDVGAAEVVFNAGPGSDVYGHATAASSRGLRSRGGPPPAAGAGPIPAARVRRYRQFWRRHWRLSVGVLCALVFITQLLFVTLFAAPLEASRSAAAEDGGGGWEDGEKVLLGALADRRGGVTGSLGALAGGRPRRWAGTASAAAPLSESAAEDDGPVDADADEANQDATYPAVADADGPVGNTSSAQPANTLASTKPTSSSPQQDLSPSPHNTTSTKQSLALTNTAATPPVKPAQWMQGGGSVRVLQAFTVLTVFTGPPMRAAQLSATAAEGSTGGRGQTAQLLRRAAVGLVHAGVTRHPSFHEWLLVHNAVLEGPHTRAAEEEAAAVRQWWVAAAAGQDRQQQQSPSAVEQPRVRVAGLAYTAASNPQMLKVSYALVHGVRLVVTEYVILHDLRWTLPRDGIAVTFARSPSSATPSRADAAYAPSVHGGAQPPAAAVVRPVEFSHNSTVAQREITAGLQTLSKNGFNALPVMVVDIANTGLAEDVHAYRLHAYATQDWRQPEREAALQASLIDYVKRARPVSSSTSPTPSLPITQSTAAPAAGTQQGAEEASGAPDKARPSARVQDGLPIAAYSASAHFHCQHAPLYAVRMPVPTWLRRTPQSTLNNATKTTTKPALTTLCEALVSQQVGLGEAFAVQGGTFYRLFCQDWLQFTLLPSPKTPVRQPWPGEDDGGAAGGEGVGGLLANLRGAAAQKENDAEAQRMDMTQRLGDGLCTVEWLAHLKAAQLRYTELAERRRAASGKALNFVPSSKEHLALTNLAGRSPYLDQYAALLFSDNTTQLSRLAGTYLAFLPDVSYALGHVRDTMEGKLDHVTLKRAVDKTRRFLSVRQPADREVVCVASHLARADRLATLYNTQWFLAHLGLRCVQHKTSCLGSLSESNERSLQILDNYLSTTGKWSRGEYRLCMSAGAYVSDPFSELP